jgi:hypothetical protein
MGVYELNTGHTFKRGERYIVAQIFLNTFSRAIDREPHQDQNSPQILRAA